MLSIGLEKSLPTRRTAGDFARDADTIKSVKKMKSMEFREGEVPGIVEIFKDDVRIGSFMTIEVAKKCAEFDRTA